MIYTERVINVKNGDASIDAPIVLYRGDRNIEIVFTIINNKFKFSEKGNYILDIGAKYGQLAVDMPNGDDLFTEIADCVDGKVIFKINGSMIDEIVENGFYSFHIRLFNNDMTSRVTIPPIIEGIEVREPIVIEGDGIIPMVDLGEVDAAVINSDDETFVDEDGKLNIEWKSGQVISSTRLNQMVQYLNDVEERIDFTPYATIDYVDNIEVKIDSAINEVDAKIDFTPYATKDFVLLELEDIDDDISNLYGELNEAKFDLNDLKNEVANGPDLSNYVVKEELDTIYDEIRYLQDYDSSNEAKIAINENKIESLESNIKQINDIIHPQNETLRSHDERIQALEEADGDDVDLSSYATIEHVETNYYNKLQVVATCTTPARVEKMINDTIGDINSILDAINGEVI